MVFFYGDNTNFGHSTFSWSYHGGYWLDGVIAGEFAFYRDWGPAYPSSGSRLEYLL
ncbi:MAG: hypothetical protein HFJ38_00570 [Bacilli bacterium]|nr:hypothetical protein [Bacilli bacterium]